MSSTMNTYSRFPVAFVKGEGARLWDDKGKEYIDFGSGISVTNLGHAHPAVTKAIAEQAATLIHTSNLFEIKYQEELAELIAEASFGGKTFFCNSGAEANEGAIKLARLYARIKSGGEKYKIISMYNSFHGRTYATLSATGQHKVQKGFEPIAGFCGYVPYNDLDALEKAIAFGDVAAVIIELYQGEGGVVPADKKYIKDMRALCDKTGTVLIFDEIQTGYGRTGELFAYKLFGVEPDIMTMAKGIANGLPMGAFTAKPEFAEHLTPGTHGSTFGGTQLCCAAAIAVIKEMTKPGFLKDVKHKGELLKNMLLEKPGDKCVLRGDGLLIGVETKYDPKTLATKCLEEGLVTIPAGNNSVRLYPPLNIPDELLKEGANRFVNALNKMNEK